MAPDTIPAPDCAMFNASLIPTPAPLSPANCSAPTPIVLMRDSTALDGLRRICVPRTRELRVDCGIFSKYFAADFP